jgi:hypothetical protein
MVWEEHENGMAYTELKGLWDGKNRDRSINRGDEQQHTETILRWQDHGGYLSFLIFILKNQICVFILITFWVSQLFKQVVGKNDYNRRMKEFNKHFVSRIKSIPSAFTCLLLCSTNLLCCISWSNSNLNESNEWAMELGVEVWHWHLSGGEWGRLGFAALHTASRHDFAWRLWKVQNWRICTWFWLSPTVEFISG